MKVQPNFNFWQNEPKFPTVQEFPAAAMLPRFTRFSSTYPTFIPRGAVCAPFSTNSNVGAGKSLPSAGLAQPKRSQNLGEQPT
jgi:hypothetical protein